MAIINIIIEVICWITVLVLALPQGNEKKCVWESLFEAAHLPVRTFGIWALFCSIFVVRIIFGLPIALTTFIVLCLQASISITILKRGCRSNVQI